MTAEKILSALNILFFPGQVVELRALGDRTQYGYYTDFTKLADDGEVLDSISDLKGIYITLNEVNPSLLARCVNRVKKAGNKEPQTGDSDIIRRRWFPIDIDAKRPAGISSSDEEHEAALHRAGQIAGFLSELGWPEPVKGDSGNGAHLLYQIDLPNDAESTQLIKTCLAGLSQIFSDAHSEVDTSVHNASRIWKLYGTTARKGDYTEERPHRKSCILSVPDEIQTVPVSELIHLASLYQETESIKSSTNATSSISSISRNYATPIDLSEWLNSHGLSHEEKPYSGGRLFVLDECPFSSAHKDGAYAIQFDSGAIFAGCHHNSCGGGSQRWSELRERFGGGSEGAKRPSQMTSEEFEEKRKQDARDRAKKIQERDGRYEKDDEKNSSKQIAIEAARILKEGNPFDYMLKTFMLDHEGDETLAKCLIMSFASRSVINSKGLHVLVTGESGKGKSHAFETMLMHVPEEQRLGGRLSDKALFYADDLKPRAAICLDDISLSDMMQEILKGVTTSFKKSFIYRTVDNNRKGLKLYIPERCVWWVAKKEGTGDDQIWNRMLTCWIDESKDQDEKVLKRELADAILPPQYETITPEILICQQMWRSLPDQWVIIPFAERIRFSSSENRRNPGMLLDIVRSHAVLMQHQREHEEHNGISCIVATIEDFKAACQLYQKLNGEDGGQMSKLTRAESELIMALRDSYQTEIKIFDMQNMTGKSYSSIQKMLHGYMSHGNHYSGLLDKCPAISFLDRTDVTDGGDTSKRNRVYVWNPELYYSWAAGGGCWLDGYDPDENHDNDFDGGNDGLTAEVFRRTENYDNVSIPQNIKNPSEIFFTPESVGGSFRRDDNVATAADSHNTNNTNNNFLDSTLRRKNESAGYPSDTTIIHDREFQTSAEAIPLHPPGQSAPVITQSETDNPRRKVPPSSATSAVPPYRPTSAPAEAILCQSEQINKGGELSNVKTGYRLKIDKLDPDKFHKIDGVWKGRCDICGSRHVQYAENWYPGKPPNIPSLLVCQKCMEKAVTREVMSVRTLPGTINIARMTKVFKSIGKCDICGVAHASWTGPDIKICDICYEREYRLNRGKATA